MDSMGIWWHIIVNERKQFLLNHPEISLSPPLIDNVNIISTDNIVTVQVSNANSVELMATVSEYNSKFQSVEMLDNGTNGDLTANDGIYSANLPFQSSNGLELKFYIRAENNDAIMLNPRRAEYEFYVYSTINGLKNINSKIDKQLISQKMFQNLKVKNMPLFYIYSDGSVEKRIIVE